MPGYFGLAVALEGEPLDLRASGVTEAGASRELARVQDSLKLLGSPQWQVRLYLANPAQLFAEQRQRTWLFGGLIIASSLAAILGLAAARGAFYRQPPAERAQEQFRLERFARAALAHRGRAPDGREPGKRRGGGRRQAAASTSVSSARNAAGSRR